MMLRLRNLAFAMAATAGAMSTGAACTAKKNTELVVAVQTDLRIPKDLNAVNIKIVALGGTYFDQTFVVGPGGVHLPQTIGIVPNDDKNLQPVDITVTGKFGNDVATAADKVIRRVRVTFAKDRVGLVRMPLRFTCYGEAKVNECGSEQTCVAGECVTIPQLEGTTLPEFNNDAVFGAGGDDKKLGTCWNPDQCLASSVPLKQIDKCTWSLTEASVGPADSGTDSGTSLDGGSDMKDSSVPMMPPDATPTDAGGGSGGDDAAIPPPKDAGFFKFKRFEQSNKVSVVVTSDKGLGFCNGTNCKLPLDFDEEEGWSWANDSHTLIKLAPGLCKTLGSATVEATDACDTKTAQIPFCDEASGGNDASTDPDTSGCRPDGKCGPGMCGSVPDGCGGFVECGGCSPPMVCDPGGHFCKDGAGDSGVMDSSTDMIVALMADFSPINAGGRKPLHAMASYASGKKADVTMLANWKTDDPSIADVDLGTYELVGVSTGFTKLHAEYMGFMAVGDINITPGAPDASADGCSPMSCGMVAGKCGPTPDGCGGTMMCSCPGGMTCMAGGCVPTSSDGGACTPKTCAMMGYNCGPAGDGCGGLLMCGTCTGGMTCGGGGIPSVCGSGGSDASVDTGGTDADAGSDPCGMSPESPPLASAPFRQGWHLVSPVYGGPMNPGTSLTAVGITTGTALSAAACSSPSTASLNGTSSYLSGTDGSIGAMSAQVEVSAWVYLDPAVPQMAGAPLVTTQNGAKGFFFGADGTGKPTFVVYMADGTSRAATASTASVPSAGWYHFVGSALAGKPVQLYVNGTSIATGGVIDKPISSNPDIAIGRQFTGGTAFWKGAVGEVRIYGN